MVSGTKDPLRTDTVNWKPSDEHDREIRQWMKAKGWEVTRTNYDSDREKFTPGAMSSGAASLQRCASTG